MNGIDLNRLEEIAEGLALAFYLLMFMALVTLLAGSVGSGFLLLIAGAIAHVGRAGIEEFVKQAQQRVPRQGQGQARRLSPSRIRAR